MRRRLRVVALMVSLLPGCARPPLAPVPPPDPRVLETTWGGGFVTARVELPDGAATPVPAVISMLGESEGLRALGLAVVSFELHWDVLRVKTPGSTPPPPPAPAGRTWGKWLLVSPSPDVIGQGYFRLITGNAETHVPRLLDWLVTLPEIDAGRIGIAGISTNGFKTLQAVAYDRRLRAAVAIAACGDYHCFLEKSSLALNGEEPLRLTPDYERWLVAREPVRHPASFVHAALLMVNGGLDLAVPAVCAIDTASVFARAYRRAGVPERFRFVFVEEGGHNLGDEVRYQTLAWFYRWLVLPDRVP